VALPKLVRDDTQRRLIQQNRPGVFYVAEHGEYRIRLREKLMEEMQEFLEARTPDNRAEEAADMVTALKALVALEGFTWAEIVKIEETKTNDRGSFSGRLVWTGA
jgi:predicted house-cleaning noncanonical NTP pyrophosphatase (MazG superfamily)